MWWRRAALVIDVAQREDPVATNAIERVPRPKCALAAKLKDLPIGRATSASSGVCISAPRLFSTPSHCLPVARHTHEPPRMVAAGFNNPPTSLPPQLHRNLQMSIVEIAFTGIPVTNVARSK